ncbi:MAG: NUDIX hydrolase [Candidatus Aenigmatarchaeota archaeon]|nr:MAG: NUDIX hydrolase [Candidatus Aenigmarchaeota archaeon]
MKGPKRRKFVIHQNPKPTVDAVVEKDGKVLLIRRGNEPYRGTLAWPGGFVDVGETVEAATLRELMEETGVKGKIEALLGVYSDPKRNIREHTIATIFVVRWISGQPEGGDDAIDAGWYDPSALKEEEFGFDHWRILQDYLKWKHEGGTFWSST